MNLGHSFLSVENRKRGFVLVELLASGLIVAALLMIWTAALSHSREQAYIAVDLQNVRQILQASALYNSENNDFMAHPTWGSDLTGPDGWAYATSTHNRPVPGALQPQAGSCAGFDTNSRQFTNQLAFFRAGQVTQYLPDVRSAWCPKDVATRQSGILRRLWLSRPMKVSSYCWNGTIGGYVGPKAHDLGGKTYKISEFQPEDWQFWDQNESNAFYFSDAGNNPETPGEGLSLRHSGAPNWWTLGPGLNGVSGFGVVGTFGGAGQLVRLELAEKFRTKGIAAPNPLLNGPGYKK